MYIIYIYIQREYKKKKTKSLPGGRMCKIFINPAAESLGSPIVGKMVVDIG